jgi:GNAT superfamily N-acetyltransferase
MYKKFIYKNLNIIEKNEIGNFIRKNFNIINLDLLPDTLIIIEYQDKIIISCICLINTKLLNADLYYFKKNSLYLYNFCVDENYRNQKKGSKLINYIIDIVSNYNVKYLYCSADNEISIKIFINNKFIKDDKFYYLYLEK